MQVKGGCSYCKEVMRRVLEQVRAETDHWNEMQKMVEKVRVEMEELQVSRDLWRRRASSAELNLRLVHSKVRCFGYLVCAQRVCSLLLLMILF